METSTDTPKTPATSLQLRIATLGNDINKQLNGGIPYATVLDSVFESLNSVIHFDRIGIAVLEDEGQTVSLRWMRSKLSGSNLTYGYSAPLQGSSLQALLDSGRPRIISDLRRYLEEHPESKSTRAVLNDGIRSSLTFPLKAEGKPVGFIFFSSGKEHTYSDADIGLFSGVAEDLSLLVQYGRLHQYFEANKSSEKFLRTALHDLRSPLGVIQGFIEVIQSENWFQGLDHESKEIFGILMRNTHFMFDLIADLSEINHMSASTRHIELHDVVLSEFLSEVFQCGQLLAQKKNIFFDAASAPNLPATWCFDPMRIRQVLDNLLTNAIKFSAPRSRITIAVHCDSQKLCFTVQDSGPGIPQNEIPKLFQDFCRISVRPTAGESTTGLGLAIARRLVEAQGGQISVESTVGVGSKFTFWIPIHESASAKARQSE